MPEYLDIVDDNGVPTGQTVERTYAHAHGVQHRTAHVWIVRHNAQTQRVEILLQKRSPNKDSHPGCWDISSAGHIPAGEDYIPSALRELQEELGVSIDAQSLQLCGQRRFGYDGQFHGQPFHDRQVTNVYLLWLDCSAEAIVPQPEEISEVRWFDFEACVQAVAEDAISHCIYPEELVLVWEGIELSVGKPLRPKGVPL